MNNRFTLIYIALFILGLLMPIVQFLVSNWKKIKNQLGNYFFPVGRIFSDVCSSMIRVNL